MDFKTMRMNDLATINKCANDLVTIDKFFKDVLEKVDETVEGGMRNYD